MMLRKKLKQVRVYNYETCESEYYKAKSIHIGKLDTLVELEDGFVIAFDNDIYQVVAVK